MVKNSDIRQFMKFITVGVMNTLITLAVIFLLKSLLHVNPWLSNAAGYIAGLLNAFFWNKAWVFRSSNGMSREAVKFLAGFLLCYGLQLGCTWFITDPLGVGALLWTVSGFTFSGYALATVMGMAVYTISNFIYNRLVTFR